MGSFGHISHKALTNLMVGAEAFSRLLETNLMPLMEGHLQLGL